MKFLSAVPFRSRRSLMPESVRTDSKRFTSLFNSSRKHALPWVLAFGCCLAIPPVFQKKAYGQEKTTLATSSALATTPMASASPAVERVQQEFRIVWGGTRTRVFQGSISIDAGQIRFVRNLSVQTSAVGCLLQKDAKTIELLATPETTFGGVDVVVEGSLASRLQFSFQDASDRPAVEHEVSLGELQDGIWIQSLGDAGDRIAVERQVADKLSIADDRPNKIFECGEKWVLKVTGNRTGLASGDYQLTAAWSGRRNSDPVIKLPVKLDTTGSFAPLELNLQIPSIEGSHRLEITLVRPSLVRSWPSQQKPLLSRSVELVAFSSEASPQKITGWRPLLAIDTVAATNAGNLSWLVSFAHSPLSARGLEISQLPSLSDLSSPEQWQRLLSLSRSLANNAPIQQSGGIQLREFPINAAANSLEKAQRCVTIETGAWLALPLTELQPGYPHRLTIQLPCDRSNMLTVAVKDAADRDQVAISPQQTIYLPEATTVEGQSSIQSEVLFWPRSDSIQIILSSGHRSQPASVGKILVEVAELSSAATSSAMPSEPQAETRKTRRVGLYIDQLFLADCLAAPREKDPNTGRPLETWATWQAIAERLVLHLQLSGANTLVLLAAGDGGSLIPLKSLPTVPWIDKSTFFTDGRSPEPHDFVNLLLKHLERSGMQLVIELDLNALTPLMAKNNREQIGFYQERLGDAHTEEDKQSSMHDQSLQRMPHNQRPLNPLHPNVQATVSDVIQEVVQRYKNSPALAGISLRLRSNSPTVFGGPDIGYNPELLQQYAKESGFQLPTDRGRRTELLSGSGRFGYLAWRAAQLTSFYQQQVRYIQQSAPGVDLYLNTIRLWDSERTQLSSSDLEAVLPSPQEYILEFGLDVDRLAAVDGLIVTQGAVRSGWNSLASSQWKRATTAESGASLGPTAKQAAFITHQPRSVILEKTDRSANTIDREVLVAESARSDSSAASSTQTSPIPKIYVDSALTGDSARQSLMNQLLRADLQMIGFGGWHPVWTLDTKVFEWIAAFKELPPVVLQDIPLISTDIPIRVRSGSYDGKHYMVLMNASEIECEVKLECGGSEPPSLLHVHSADSETTLQSERQIKVKLAAGKLIAWRWEGNPPEILSIDVTPSQMTVADLTRRLTRLEANLARASDSVSQRVLFHGSGTFEQWPDVSKPVGWNVSSLPNTLIQRATELPRSGQSCMALENRNPSPASAWIQSTAIELPKTGRLTLRAWLRSSAADHRSPLVKLGVIGRLKNGHRFEQSVQYGGLDNIGRTIANDWGRRPAELHLSDIPIDEMVDLQVAIDLIGEGRIWVDDVEVIETWLHPDERNYLRGQLLVAKQKLAENNPFPAEKLLRSPWALYLQELDSDQTQVQTNRFAPTPKGPESTADWNQPKSTLQQWREAWLDRWRR